MSGAEPHPRIWHLENSIQEYTWGSATAIPELLGKQIPSSKPQAELWMGAHPKAPSHVLTEKGPMSLISLINSRPEKILGKSVSDRFEGKLPFLFKVLAAEKPLSIQAHPNLEQAKEGFSKEESLQIPIDAGNRNYRDSNHKPEIICALTSFWAMMGFRDCHEILHLIDSLGCSSLRNELEAFRQNPNEKGLRVFFKTLLEMPHHRKAVISREAAALAMKKRSKSKELEWIVTLNRYYPDDAGVLSPMLLNLVELKPGEALSMEAGQLHAYLGGLGIELMANSDNVLRGGLTSKHIDTVELEKIYKSQSADIRIISPLRNASGEKNYRTNFQEFLLTSLELHDEKSYIGSDARSIEIWIVVEGEVRITDFGRDEIFTAKKGNSFLVPAFLPRYRMEGIAKLFRASVP